MQRNRSSTRKSRTYGKDLVGHVQSSLVGHAMRLYFADEQAIFIATSQANADAGRIGEKRNDSFSNTRMRR